MEALPVTIRALVTIGSIFKRGGYRSFANYVSAIKATHIEDGREWAQLLAHTGGWVTRSVSRGMGSAEQNAILNR